MQYFTHDLHLMGYGEKKGWEKQAKAYREACRRASLPPDVGVLADLSPAGHRLLSADEKRGRLVLRLNGQQTVAYTLAGEVTAGKPRNLGGWRAGVLRWLSHEVSRASRSAFVHRILFDDGTEWKIPFRSVEVAAFE